MFDFISRFFKGEPSGATAKERLRLVLLSDHLALAPDVVQSLKADLIAVISRYVDVDPVHCDVSFEQQDRSVAMLANIPILGMKARPSGPSDGGGGLPRSPDPPVEPVPVERALDEGAAVRHLTVASSTAFAAPADELVTTEPLAGDVPTALPVQSAAKPARPRRRRRRAKNPSVQPAPG